MKLETDGDNLEADEDEPELDEDDKDDEDDEDEEPKTTKSRRTFKFMETNKIPLDVGVECNFTRLLVREEYELLTDAIDANRRSGKDGMMITGQPGIGA